MAEQTTTEPGGFEIDPDAIAAALSSATGKSVTVMSIVDPSILGGVVSRIGDTVFDGSVRHRLDQLKEAI